MAKPKLDLTHPEVAKEWHPTKNGELKPSDFTYGSGNKVWWKCPEGDDHEWSAPIASRTSSNQGCACCAGKKACKDNRLDLLYPEIAKEWHPTKNSDLKPSDCTKASDKKVWWKCPKGDDHEWETAISGRTGGAGCPYCSGNRVSKDNNLLAKNPKLAKEWHPTKNGELKPSVFTSGSHKKVWWKCPKEDDHEWETSIKERSRGRGCPHCAGKRVSQNNNLLAKNPKLAKEWHPTKNDDLKPSDFTYRSGKKVWWKCPEGDDHEWDAPVAGRMNGEGCPFCSGKRVSKQNNLLALYPELAKQWHPTKNGELKPAAATPHSGRKAWWKCPDVENHEWETPISGRTRGTGCPYCSSNRVSEDNNLAAMNPKLAKEWHPTKNGVLKPLEVAAGSDRKVWWKCLKGNDHEWETAISGRTTGGAGCPYCSGNRVSNDNNLLAMHPEVAKQWHPTKNGKLKPSYLTSGSKKKVWWKCPKGDDHEWKTSVNERSRGRGCPYCSNKKVSKDNNLLAMHPEVAKQWHPTKNGKLKPIEFTSGTHQKVWWKCPKGNDHEWKTSIKERSRGRGCPKCTKQTSEPEIRILAEIKFVFRKVESRYQLNSQEADVFLPEHKIAIEYDGSFYHQKKEITDRAKGTFFHSIGVKLIRVRQLPLKKISKQDILVKSDPLTKKDLNKLMNELKLMVPSSLYKNIDSYVSEENFLNEKDFKKYLSFFPDPFPENSFKVLHPHLSKEWHYEKNFPLEPQNFSIGTHKKVWWKCSKGDDHEWEASISNRSKGSGCPYCSGNRVSKDNNLLAKNPKLAKEWHPTKNVELKPSYLTSGSKKKVWWKCPKGDDHEWKTSVDERSRGRGCPYCSGKRVSKDNNLLAENPKLAKEWHPSQNGDLKPSDITTGTSKKVWWKCSKGDDHEWEASISNRSKGTGCPYCAGKRVS